MLHLNTKANKRLDKQSVELRKVQLLNTKVESSLQLTNKSYLRDLNINQYISKGVEERRYKRTEISMILCHAELQFRHLIVQKLFIIV